MNNSNKEVGQVELVKFNEVISIEVPVDSIAKKLYDTMDKTNPHAALVTNTIIGFGMSAGHLSSIYNSLNGWKDELNITIGKQYEIPAKKLDMYHASEDWKTLPRIVVTVKEINEYTTSSNNVEVAFDYTQKDGQVKQSTVWVSHKELMEISAL